MFVLDNILYINIYVHVVKFLMQSRVVEIKLVLRILWTRNGENYEKEKKKTKELPM